MHHFDCLRKSVEGFTNADREAILGEFDANASKYVFHVPVEPTDANWTLLLGDFIYDTRANLDYLITALIRSTGKEEHETSPFPIYGIDRVGWNKSTGSGSTTREALSNGISKTRPLEPRQHSSRCSRPMECHESILGTTPCSCFRP